MRFDRKALQSTLSVLTFGLTVLAAVLGWESIVPVIFVLGFFIVVPLVALLGDSLPIVESETDGAAIERDETADDPVARLRAQYAEGKLSDEEFERRLERLLETEDVEATGSRERVFDRE